MGNNILSKNRYRSATLEKRKTVTHSCPTLCGPKGCSLPGSSVHGILQTRILEWVAIPFSKGSSQPRDQTQVSCIADRFFTVWATREAHFTSVNPIQCMSKGSALKLARGTISEIKSRLWNCILEIWSLAIYFIFWEFAVFLLKDRWFLFF